jgi:hypothetical protein
MEGKKEFNHEKRETCEMEKGIDARLHPDLLPQEKGQRWYVLR